MTNDKEKLFKNIFLTLIFVVAIILRLIPHLPNFVPITALALFAGVYFSGPLAYLLPLLAMISTDIFLGFHSTMLFVYCSIILSVFIGQLARKKKNPLIILGATLTSSILFFLITNFGVWLTTNWYPATLAGLILCFQMAIPFFRNSLSGDFFYAIIFFGSYEFAVKYILNKSGVKHVTGKI